ncbi:Na(+)-translocating NADH-quinone reductase subunit C [Aliiglaciecola sp. CAU 1673]|uniref:Na(+)-translocating NADH-quinone reductase subunit C n=1 Tax=Aliiglaciecola sp. CAU 1673 TaxID=3032595 RepID=UPI0023DB6D65|nr:Na(+)-translocating NADH-quinone reductase subunit C [Aliiglaciecola sp. CAU 1673]MDF2176795.1 Na(+)-translocating NADH-quinone reductase subunit C [Aliiglaciecola sp. CAU 1673]
MSAKKETLGRTVGVVVAVCLVCSIVVSGAAVGLRSLQTSNAQLDKQSNILAAAGLLEQAKGNIAGTYEQFIEEKYVDLESGQYVEKEAGYDMYKAARDPQQSIKPQPDTAGILRRANVASVYLVKDEAGNVSRIVLPVHGSGLWNLMYGMLAIDSDGNTVREFVYYDQKETPGLGGEVQNPEWMAKWNGKKLFNDGELAIQVRKGANPDNPYSVDALSGATLTSNGVQHTLDYWLGSEGFGPFLAKQPWKS